MNQVSQPAGFNTAAEAVPETVPSTTPPIAEPPTGSDDQTLPAQPSVSEAIGGVKRSWYLGIDCGTTGFSAVLLDRVSQKLYPIYWRERAGLEAETKSYRLPTAVYLPAQPLTSNGLSETRVAVGSQAIALALRDRDAIVVDTLALPGATELTPELFIQNIKPYLKVGIPHYATATDSWEPVIQWSDYRQIPLSWLQQALQSLLQTLNPVTSNSDVVCGANGLDAPALKSALAQLEGVILGYPANWPDTYNFNLREAVLEAKLVSRPEQIFFVEDAIAAVLSELRNPNRSQWKGGTLVINAGATTSEMVLVNLPDHLPDLTHSDFSLRSLPYAGNVIDQDIICQLLHPQWFRQSRTANRSNVVETQWHWQAEASALDGLSWDSLGLDTIPLPIPGEPDLETRHRLQQRLESSPLGQGLLEAARHLKLILQHEEQFTFELGDQRWMIMRRQLESQVFLPFIQRLNRELNVLLSQTGLPMQAINQAICTGGTASLPAIARWLRQKLPNATIIQDTYQGDRSLNIGDKTAYSEDIDDVTTSGAAEPKTAILGDRLVSCSRVAYGLAALPLYPQVLDLPRQQYGDYFLLLELLRAFPSQPVSIAGIMQLLERRGINTHACQLHILALLEGHLPPGLVPLEQDRNCLTESSKQYLDGHALTAAPLFLKEGNQVYRPNLEQCRRLQEYLSQVMANTKQTLEEPFAVNLSLAVE
ncbi:hypothetical protein H6F90_04535 [Trichocoleus sp. FACHB-591]|uniref:hypothetical protein n=1 Tax=Trichocoleus sp. FACHB-591 TaxID=2692872 RepID=UPI0016846AA0|nr:hypothetical protein [Trichocoleus sp. FACHB-591]MBD2094418.1 hypothetical protein [Trichocoleus sp. FACHB-591]